MASAPDESGATAELQQLKVQDDDYNPFTEEGMGKTIWYKYDDRIPGLSSRNLAACRGLAWQAVV